MADSNNIQLQQEQLKEVETILGSVEQRIQRLAVLQKSIELKIIDPQDSVRFELFLKQLANVDTKNIENLRKYITGANNEFDNLIQHSRQFAKQSDDTNKILISQNEQLAIVASKFDKSKSAIKKMGDELQKVEESIDAFISGVREGNEELYDYDKVQSNIIDSFKKMSNEQQKQLELSIGISSGYEDFANNIDSLIKRLEGTQSPIGNLFNLDINEIESMAQAADAALKDIGKGGFSFDGNEISEEYRTTVLAGMVTAGEKTISVLQGHISAAKESITDISGVARDVVDLMVKDIVQKTTGMGPELSTDEMQKVGDAWKKIDSNANPALKAMVAQTSDAAIQAEKYTMKLNSLQAAIPVVDKLSNQFGMLNRFSEQMLNSLEFATRDVMPNWLYQTLGLDSAFSKLSETAQTGLTTAAEQIANGASTSEALAGFAGQFGKSMITALGPITLIAGAIAGLYTLMQSVRQEVSTISKELGVSKTEAKEIYKNTLSIVSATDNLYVKQEDVLSVLKKHKEEYGLIMDLNSKASQEAIKFSSALGKQYGVGADEIYGFTSQLQNLGADQKTSEGLAAWAANASELAGVPFTNITKDLAESSEFVAMNFANMPEEAVKATIKLRAMGSSLKQVEKGMQKAFDISSFMQGMTELNVMTQGVVDLSKYFDLTTSLAPAADQAEEMNKQFDKLMASGKANYFTMKQFADVTGQSIEELQRGNKIRQMQGKLTKEQLDVLTKYSDKLTEAELTDARSAAMAAEKLSANEKLDATWESIKATLVEALMPAIEAFSGILSGLAPILKIVGVVLKGLAAPIALVGDIINGIIDMVTFEGLPSFEGISSIFGDWSSGLKIAGNLASIFIGVWAGTKLLGTLGSVTDIFKNWGSSIGGLGGKFTDLFSGATKSMGGMFKGFADGAKNSKGLWGKVLGGVKGGWKALKGGKIEQAVEVVSGNNDSCACMQDAMSGGLGDLASDITSGLGGTSIGGAAPDADGKKQNSADGKDGKKQQPRDSKGRFTKKTPDVDVPKPKSGGFKGRMKGLGGLLTGGLTALSLGSMFSGDSGPTTTDVVSTGADVASMASPGTKAATTAASTATSTATNVASTAAKSGSVGGKILSGAKDIGGKALKGLKSINPLGLATAAIGMGADYLGGSQIEEGMQTGDKGKVNTGRALKAGATALEYGGIGATIGSIIPGIGTAVGGAVGGVIGGAVGIWENYFSEDAKAQDAQLEQSKKGNEIGIMQNSVLNGISDSTLQALEQAGYTEEVLNGLKDGSLSVEDAIKAQYKDANFSEDQLKVISDPNSDPAAIQAAMNAAFGVSGATPPSLDVGTDLVKKDGIAMLHQGEAVVPADVAKGGFSDMMESTTPKVPTDVSKGGFSNMMGSGEVVPVEIVKDSTTGEKSKRSPLAKMIGSTSPFGPIGDALTSVFGNVLPQMSDTDAPKTETTNSVNVPNVQMQPITATPQIEPTGLTETAKETANGTVTENSTTAPQTSAAPTNSDSMLSQISRMIEMYANRPVVVQVGGTELRSLNKSLKVYNNV